MEPLRTNIPARLDRLPWSRFHLLIIIALGVTWTLDGLEVTIVGAISGVLQDPRTLHLSAQEIGALASFYLAGAVGGALLFGWLTDRFGRRKIFYVTLALYLAGVALSAVSWNFVSFAGFRLITGAGIGGEYAAVNSAIDELMPARLRGRLDLAINGTYWLGAGMGALATIFLLDPARLPVDLGWRLGFAIGAVLGCVILLLRGLVPESPRWLIVHGHPEEAERAVTKIEQNAGANTPAPDRQIPIYPRKSFGLGVVAKAMLGTYRTHSLLALSLMVAQAFLYNALFFTYGLVLTRFYGVPAGRLGIYLLPMAAGNFLGPLLLGRFFDTVGRRVMIGGTYAIAALLLVVTGYLFARGVLNATTQTVAWSAIFFVASAAASAAYLTASEIFPLEIRALAIACFYAAGTAVGGVVAPWLFGTLIGVGSRWYIFEGYLLAALLMLIAAVAEWKIGVNAEGQSLEAIAAPLSSVAE